MYVELQQNNLEIKEVILKNDGHFLSFNQLVYLAIAFHPLTYKVIFGLRT